MNMLFSNILTKNQLFSFNINGTMVERFTFGRTNLSICAIGGSMFVSSLMRLENFYRWIKV